MAKKNTNGLIPLLIGVLLLLMVLNNGGEARNVPVFDEDTEQDFRLELSGFDSTPDAGTPTQIEVEVVNRGETGTMFVQCSILNYFEEGAFLVNREASVDFLTGTNPNCVNPEPFTSIAEVYLEADNETTIVFNITTPSDDERGDYTVYCAAFEQCWSEDTPEVYETDSLTRDIEVIFDSEEAINATSGTTSLFNFRDLDNYDVRDFLRHNSIIVVFIAIFLMILGGILVYGLD